MNAAFANHLWLLTSRRAAHDFHRAAHCVAETQSHLLHSYLISNRDTLYVRTQVDTYTGKQGDKNYHLPLTNYEDYLPYIERITNGEKNILTRDPVQLFELSSGSTAASKMIPYTRTLQSEFGRGLSAWIHDLFTHHADLITGPAYWSISPLTAGPRRTPAGIPIGFEEDSAYLGPLGALIESALAVPNLVKHIRDPTAFRYVTLLFLLRCSDLCLISVWNPTFLTLLLAPLPEWWDSLLKDIANGTITPPAPLDETIHQVLLKKLPRNTQYAVRNTQHATRLASLNPTDYASIWPHLRLISCWADGASEPYARELQTNFPKAILQPKGLIATEAFVSFPLFGKTGGALAVTSHYFEFLTDSGDIFLAHQLEKGKTYSVVVTTGGGLYRYQLNDLIEVTDFYGQVPCFNFIGKADRVSDYFGEKLNEQFVANVLAQLFEKHNLAPAFYMLAPDDTDPFHYTLYLELPSDPRSAKQCPEHVEGSPDFEPKSGDFDSEFAAELDVALRANFHYDYCRRLGQLAETQAILVTRGAEKYIQACQSRGQKLGDIKPSVLQKSTGWGKWFRG